MMNIRESLALTCIAVVLAAAGPMPAASGNRIENGGFEACAEDVSRVPGWKLMIWGEGAAEMLRVPLGDGKGFALRIDPEPGTRGAVLTLDQGYIAARPGQRVRLSFRYKLPAGASGRLCRVKISPRGRDGKGLDDKAISLRETGGSWRDVSLETTMPPGTVRVLPLFYSQDEPIWYDDVSLVNLPLEVKNPGDPGEPARTTVCLRAATPPELSADPASWGAVPVPLDRVRVPDAYQGPRTMSGTAYLMWDDEHLYVGVVVRDDRFLPAEPGKLWTGDCIQFYFDPEMRRQVGGRAGSDQNWLAGLLPGGSEVMRYICPAPLEPRAILAPGTLPREVRLRDGRIIYALAIPWAQLGWDVPTSGWRIGFDIAANDADSLGDVAQDTPQREMNQIEWTPGIMGGRDPSRMGTLVFADVRDVEAVLETATDLALPDVDGVAWAAGQTRRVQVRVPALVADRVTSASVRLLNQDVQPVVRAVVEPHGDPGDEGYAVFSAELTLPGELPDGEYVVESAVSFGERTVRWRREVTVSSEEVAAAVGAIERAESRSDVVDRRADADVRMRYARCLDTARTMLELGRLTIAFDVAEQALAWSQREELALDLPPTPTEAELGEVIAGAEWQQTRDGMTTGADATHWVARSEGFEVRLSRETFALEMRELHDGGPSGRSWRAASDVAPTASFLVEGRVREVPLAEAARQDVRPCASTRGVGLEVELGGFKGLPAGCASKFRRRGPSVLRRSCPSPARRRHAW